MELGILGPLQIVGADRSRYLVNANKVRILLGNLLVERDRVVSAKRLTDELWDGVPPRTARTGLQVYISTLRKILHRVGLAPGVASIVTEPPGYAIHVQAQAVDITRFDEARRMAVEAESSGDRASASLLLSGALGQWRGPALADVRSTPLLGAEARRLDETRIAVFEKRVQIDLALGRSGDLIGELYAYVAEYPLHERLCEYLMTALYDHGRPADALEVYSTYRSAMRDLVGLEPGPRMRQLQQGVLARRPLDELVLRDPATFTRAAAQAAPCSCGTPAPGACVVGAPEYVQYERDPPRCEASPGSTAR